MSTTINKTNGTVLVSIADGAVDTAATDLTLIGKLYRNYGEVVNENFVKLLRRLVAPSPTLLGTVKRIIILVIVTCFVQLIIIFVKHN